MTGATALLSAHQGDANDGEKLDGVALKPDVRGRLSVGRSGCITVNIRKDKYKLLEWVWKGYFIGKGCVRLKIHYWTVISDFKLLGN